MPLTKEEKRQYEETLTRTAGPRDQLFASRMIPQSYADGLSLVDREDRILKLPGVVPVRVVISKAKSRKAKCPLHINMHGGGFYIRQNEDDDMYCAHLASGIQGVVIDIDYATTHDHPFPTAFEQCYAVMKWAFEQAEQLGVDVRRISAGGLSAGGNLAAAVALRATATKDFHLCLEVLDCAATDNHMALTPAGGERTAAFSELYCDGDVRLLSMPYCSPAFSTDAMLVGMPRTLVIAAGLCPFKETNERFAGRLAAAGTEVTIKTFPRSHHGFTVRMIDDWQAAQDVIIRHINDLSR